MQRYSEKDSDYILTSSLGKLQAEKLPRSSVKYDLMLVYFYSHFDSLWGKKDELYFVTCGISRTHIH